MAERNISFSPKGGASVAFQKIFGGGDGAAGGAAILAGLHAIQKSCAGLRATRKVATNPNAATITGAGTRAVLTFVCADNTTTKLKVEHFDPTKSVNALGAALVGHVFNAAGSATTSCVQATTESVFYV